MGEDRAEEMLQVGLCRVGDRWAPAGGREGREALPRPAPGLGKEREETPRNAVAWTVERDSQFLDRFYSKEPREEVRSGGKK